MCVFFKRGIFFSFHIFGLLKLVHVDGEKENLFHLVYCLSISVFDVYKESFSSPKLRYFLVYKLFDITMNSIRELVVN